MAEQTQTDSPFTKWFLPGLIVGLLVGMAAGAFLPTLFLDRAPVELKPAPNMPRSTELRDPPPGSTPSTESKPAENKPAESKPVEPAKTDPSHMEPTKRAPEAAGKP